VNAAGTLVTFSTMYLENKLLCGECYGMDKSICTSTDPACQEGLQDLSMSGAVSRWDQALGVFTQTQSDLNCAIEDSSQCSEAPHCTSDHGPAGLALVKSMTTIHNSLSNIYMAIDRAHTFASGQMGLFTEVFAPVPSLKNEAIFTEIMFVIAGLVAGILLPGVGALVAALALGVGSAFVMNDMIFGQPSAPDTSSVLDKIASNTQGAYSGVADSLFTNGSYSYSPGGDAQDKTISWSSLMADGKLLQQQDNMTEALETVYERILYQQLAIYTWQNLETGKNGHVPFIVFDTKPCDQFSPSNKTSLEHVIGDISKSDTNMTYNGGCYFLLDGTTKEHLGKHHCIGKALPGGTNKELIGNSEEFKNLSLADFIIPSVNGWQAHAQQNGYNDVTNTGQVFTDPQAAGVVNFPICDYLGNPDSPGMYCPKWGGSNGSSCYQYDASTGINKPGDYVEGRCGVHVEQWQMKGAENPLGSYQLSVTIADADNRLIGSATKQSAAETLEIVDSVLPYDLYVATGSGDSGPIRFWYSDQYWDSSSQANQCSVGKYDKGARQMDCSFKCPKPTTNGDGSSPVSPTVANPFPNTPVAAVGGNTTYVNTYTTAGSSDIAAASTSSMAAPTSSMAAASTSHMAATAATTTERNYCLIVNMCSDGKSSCTWPLKCYWRLRLEVSGKALRQSQEAYIWVLLDTRDNVGTKCLCETFLGLRGPVGALGYRVFDCALIICIIPSASATIIPPLGTVGLLILLAFGWHFVPSLAPCST